MSDAVSENYSAGTLASINTYKSADKFNETPSVNGDQSYVAASINFPRNSKSPSLNSFSRPLSADQLEPIGSFSRLATGASNNSNQLSNGIKDYESAVSEKSGGILSRIFRTSRNNTGDSKNSRPKTLSPNYYNSTSQNPSRRNSFPEINSIHASYLENNSVAGSHYNGSSHQEHTFADEMPQQEYMEEEEEEARNTLPSLRSAESYFNRDDIHSEISRRNSEAGSLYSLPVIQTADSSNRRDYLNTPGFGLVNDSDSVHSRNVSTRQSVYTSNSIGNGYLHTVGSIDRESIQTSNSFFNDRGSVKNGASIVNEPLGIDEASAAIGSLGQQDTDRRSLNTMNSMFSDKNSVAKSSIRGLESSKSKTSTKRGVDSSKSKTSTKRGADTSKSKASTLSKISNKSRLNSRHSRAASVDRITPKLRSRAASMDMSLFSKTSAAKSVNRPASAQSGSTFLPITGGKGSSAATHISDIEYRAESEFLSNKPKQNQGTPPGKIKKPTKSPPHYMQSNFVTSMQHKSPISSSNSTRRQSSKSETILRKYFENGKWFEEAKEFHYRQGENGKTKKTYKSNVRELNPEEIVGMEPTNDFIKNLHTEAEMNAQRISKQGKGKMQDDQEEFSTDVLKAINNFRIRHGVKPLKISSNLSDYARSWARHLIKTDEIKSKNRRDLGDAIYHKRSTIPWEPISGEGVVNKWYEEISSYNFDEPSELKSGNFTQIVWKSSKSIGAGVERTRDGLQTIVVVFFYPKGNWPGLFKDQVPPIGGFEKQKRNEKGIMVPALPDSKECFPKAVLKAHNFFRAKHSALPVVLEPSLCKYSQEWADKLASKDKLQPRSNNIYGENIYRATFEFSTDISEIPGAEAVAFWYSKKTGYNFKQEPTNLNAAPFTQLIWADSRDLGVGIAKSKTNKFYVVANYNPPGNLVGQFIKKVQPIKWNIT